MGTACVLHLLQEKNIELDRAVAEFWREFAQAGKERITLAQLLSHQAGLCALDERVDVLGYDAVIDALEAQKPLWPPVTVITQLTSHYPRVRVKKASACNFGPPTSDEPCAARRGEAE
jgi:hypothetical protein